MLVSKIGFKFNINNSEHSSNVRRSYLPINKLNQPESDKFIKSDSIPFQSGVIYSSQKFEQEFPRAFFRKLLQEGLPCAYTGIEMIPRSDVDRLLSSGVLNRPSGECIRYLSQYKNSMYPTEKKVLTYLEKQAQIHPEMTLQELVRLRYNDAEKALISRQAVVLNRINMIARELSDKDFRTIRILVNDSFDKIFAKNPLPEDRFKRKGFIYDLNNIKISNENIKQKLIKIAENLPQSSDSVNSFIVKYSQPYKVKYDEWGNIIKVARDSQELGVRLLHPSIATDEHIYPQKLYKWEELARQCGDITVQDLSDVRVTILTSAYINTLKSDTLLDHFIKTNNYNIKENIQKHVDRLIEIDKKWLKTGRIEDAHKLANYILVLKEEFDRRSKIVNINIDEFKNFQSDIETGYQKFVEKRNEKRLKKQESN